MQLLLLVHKMFYHSNLLSGVFANYFIINSSVHDHQTRSMSDIRIHRAHTTFGQRAVSYKGGTLWNCLTRDLELINSTSVFKSKLKHLFDTSNQ